MSCGDGNRTGNGFFTGTANAYANLDVRLRLVQEGHYLDAEDCARLPLGARTRHVWLQRVELKTPTCGADGMILTASSRI